MRGHVRLSHRESKRLQRHQVSPPYLIINPTSVCLPHCSVELNSSVLVLSLGHYDVTCVVNLNKPDVLEQHFTDATRRRSCVSEPWYLFVVQKKKEKFKIYMKGPTADYSQRSLSPI